MRSIFIVALSLAVLFCGPAARAQNPIQWNGNATTAIARAQEQQLPLMFWLTERQGILDDDDLRNAQSRAFRDPAVVALAQHRFVPVRVFRNSRVLEEAQRFGLPTEFGLYIALITPDGRLLDKIEPLDVASPEALAERLAAGFTKYRDGLYQQQLRAIITNKEAPRDEVRSAVQTVWRLGILSADADIVALLDRADVTASDRARLYSMLASFATQPGIEALLNLAANNDRDAVTALARAEGGALEWLLPELPRDQEPTARQLAAYRAAVQISRSGAARPDSFWTSGTQDARDRELERIRRRAEPVLDFWKESIGRWR